MTSTTETIPEYLARVMRKDSPGWRTTREVADFYRVSLATARRRLNALYDKGEIDSADGGRGHEWRAIPVGRS